MTCTMGYTLVGNFKIGFTFKLDKRHMENQVVKYQWANNHQKRVTQSYQLNKWMYYPQEDMLLKCVTS